MPVPRMRRRLHDAGADDVHMAIARGPVEPRRAAGMILALADEAVRTAGHPAGTDSGDYRSPEEGLGASRSPAGDVFALGLLLQELLTGWRRFEGHSPWGTPAHRLFGSASATKALLPRTPSGLQDIVARALAHDPVQRYPNLGAFADAIRRWLDEEPIGQSDVDRDKVGLRFGVWAPDARHAAVLILALLVIGFVGVRSLSWLGWPEAEPLPTREAAVRGAGGSPIASPARGSARPQVAKLNSPQAVVRTFYRHLARSAYRQAHALMSASLRGQVPPEELAERYADTTAITLESVQTTRTAEGASVAIDLLEQTSSGESLRLRGWWTLILEDGEWVLDQPSF